MRQPRDDIQDDDESDEPAADGQPPGKAERMTSMMLVTEATVIALSLPSSVSGSCKAVIFIADHVLTNILLI